MIQIVKTWYSACALWKKRTKIFLYCNIDVPDPYALIECRFLYFTERIIEQGTG